VSNSAPKHRAPVDDTPKASRRARARLKRRWPRRTLFAANGLVLACIAATATAYAYVQHELNSIAIGPSRHTLCEGCYAGGGGKLPKSDVIQADGLQSENILLIGNETRQGLTPQEQQQYGSSLIYSGTLADIIMILHLDPVTDTASILSIPRDLFAPMPLNSPVGPFQKIDAALNDGTEGPDNLVAAIEQDFGIPINHFVELNFNGFINSVNALGGINVYFPEPVYDAESLLNIKTPGCKHLNGVEALALVRARHLQYDPPGDTEPKYDWPQEAESDLARIGRTHTFMKIVSDTAIHEGKTNPLQAVSFINAILKQITIDKGLKSELLKLVKHYGTLNPANVPETTFPTSDYPATYYYGDADIGDVLFPVQPQADKVIRAWDPQAFPKAVAPKSVSVVSLAGDYYSAQEAGQALSSHGLHVTSETGGEVPASTTGTFVVYPSGGLSHALYVMKYLSGAVMLEESSSVPAGTVEVDLGTVTNVSAKPTTTTAATTTTGEAATTGEATTTLPATTTTSAAPTTTAARTPLAHPAATTTTVPTPDGMVVNSSADQTEPWDPRACPS
jgi:LCP family protein required for cell wall assembly